MPPVPAFRRPADAWVERVGWVELTVEIPQGRLGVVKVADIVLSGILRAARIEELPQRMLDRQAVLALADQIFLVKDVAKEVAAIHLENELCLDLIRQRFEPVERVARQGDVERDDVLDR